MWFDGTFAQKFIAPFLIPPFLIGMTIFVAREDGFAWSSGVLLILILWTGFYLSISLRLKRVRVIGENVEISDRRRRAIVPLASIQRVERAWGGHPKIRRLVFREPTEFGTSVIYMPRWRYIFFQRDWPELEKLSLY